MWKYCCSITVLCVLLCAVPTYGVLNKIIMGTLTDDSVPAQEAWTGQKMYVVHRFGGFCDESWYGWVFGEMLMNWNAGRVTHYTMSPTNKWCAAVEINPADPNQYITQGKWDAQLGWFIRGLKTFISGPDGVLGNSDDRRLFIRLAHELNGNWYPWSANATSYQEMWRYVVDRVRAQGFTKSQLQWIFEPVSPWEADLAHDFRRYWPGDAYVDWLSLDAYNNQMFQEWYEPWEMFDSQIYKLRDWRPQLPVMISETGSDSTNGNTARKNTWITSLASYLAQMNVQMLVYFNTNDSPHDWPVFWKASENVGVTSIVGTDGITYNVYPNWKTALQTYAYQLTSPTSPRIMTDDEFQGRLPGYQSLPAQPRNLVIYNNGKSYYEWSCTPAPYAVNLVDTAVVRSGDTYSMSLTLTPWGNVQLHSAQMGANTSNYNSIQFSINTVKANVKLSIRAFTSSGELTSVQFTVPNANTWTQFTFTWAQLSLPLGVFVRGFYLQGASNDNQGKAYFAAIQLLSNPLNWPAGWGTAATPAPTAKPTAAPTAKPTVKATASPTVKATVSPTVKATAAPTAKATAAPTAKATAAPTAKATAAPTAKATAAPTAKATAAPTAKATAAPTAKATAAPTSRPATQAPTARPTSAATPAPTAKPSWSTNFASLSSGEGVSGSATVSNGLTLTCSSAVNGVCARWQTHNGFGYGNFTFRVKSAAVSGTSAVMMGESTSGTYSAWEIGLPGYTNDVTFQAYGGYQRSWASYATGFNPTTGYHEYTLSYGTDLKLYADGKLMFASSGAPTGPMRLVIYATVQTTWYGALGTLPAVTYANYASWTSA